MYVFFEICTLAHKSTHNRVKCRYIVLIYARWEQTFKYFDGLVIRNSFFFFSEEIFSFICCCLYVFQFQNILFSAESYSFSCFIIYIAYHYIYLLNSLYFFQGPPIIKDISFTWKQLPLKQRINQMNTIKVHPDSKSIQIIQRESSFVCSPLQWNGHKSTFSVAINVTHVIEVKMHLISLDVNASYFLYASWSSHIYGYRKRQLVNISMHLIAILSTILKVQ